MKKKILKAFTNPSLVFQYATKKLMMPFLNRTYTFSPSFRSDSDNGYYNASIKRALSSQKTFDNFKRDPYYNAILEHVSQEHGQQYLNVLKSRNDGFLEKALKSVLLSDEVGNPRKSYYEEVSMTLSPTTLRYVKVASDIRLLFGGDIDRTAEIGCGYGGQCLVNDQLLGVKSATLFDLPVVNDLIERYLESFLLQGSYKTTTINRIEYDSYELVISNYAFAELPGELQIRYIEKVLSSSQRGYLTMNSGRGGAFDKISRKLNISELKDKLPRFEVIEEKPLTYEYNYIIVWGHNPSVSL